MTDPLSDMITRIMNAAAVGKSHVVIPHSKFKEAILTTLHKVGYVASVEKKGKGPIKELIVELSYDAKGTPKIAGASRVSKFSARRYAGARDLKPVKQGRGMYILTTPAGVVTDAEAREKKVGGEVIFKIW